MAEGKGTYSGIYKMLGAAKAAADNLKVARSMNRVLSMSTRMRAGMLGMTSALAGAGASLVALGMAARRVVSEYARYTIAQSRISTTLAAQLPNYRAVTTVVGQHADMVGRRLGYSLTESNEAMMTMLQTGLGAHRSMRVFNTAMQLARVADMDTANATRFLTDTMNMFRVEAARGGEEAQHFARRMASQLTVAANMASTNIENLQQAFRYAGGEMSSLGYSSQDTMAALAALSSVGLRGTTAGTRLRGAIAALHTPSSTATRLLRELGGVTEDQLNTVLYTTEGRLRTLSGPDGAMVQLNNLMQQMPTDFAQNTAVIRIFGRRAQAAGGALSGLSEAGERTERIYNRLQRSDVTEGGIFDEQVIARTRSFGFQVEQLKNGIGDLSIAFGEILFGAMDRSGDGFGSHVRNVAAAIRLSGQLSNMTTEQRREWEALGPEVQSTGQNYRELFTNIASFLRVLGIISRYILRAINEYPRLTLALVALRLVMGVQLIPTIVMLIGKMMLLNMQMRLSYMYSARQRAGMRLMSAGIALLGITIANEVVPHIRNFTMELGGLQNGMREIADLERAWGTATAERIPIVGNLIAEYIRLVATMYRAYQAEREVQDRRSESERQVRSTAQERITARTIDMMSQEQYAGRSREEVRGIAASREQSESMQRMAALLYRGGIRGEESVSEYGESQGLAEETINQIVRIQRTQGEILHNDAARMLDGFGVNINGAEIGTRDLHGATVDAASQLRGLSETVAQINADATPGGEMVGTGYEMPVVQDASVSRGGLIRASSGDVIVSREHLARAVAMRRGAMVGPAMGEGVGDRTVAGPAASGGGGGGDGGGGGGDIVLMIDGTEVARAVGRAHVRHLERSGASFGPGQRRTMRETGFTERLG